MRRITTPTAAQDLFGAGFDGFTDGSAPSPPPTHLNADWFNQVQEEIARAVEGNGATVVVDGGTANYFQLDDAISDMARVMAASSATSNRFITEGLTFSISGTSLSTTLAQGRMVFDGRKYNISTAKLTAAGFVSWGPLTASRDHYFFIAPENPGALATPPNRNTVYVTRSDVANGASAPATPAGTVLFAMLVTSGTDITAVTYYNRGPRLVNEAQAQVAFRPNLGTDIRNTLHPGSIAVDLGYQVADSNEGYWDRCYFQELNLRSEISSLYSHYVSRRYSEVTTTSAGGTTQQNLLDQSNYDEGTTVYVEVRGVGFDLTDPTDGYSFRIEAHAHIDGGVWDMDGSFASASDFGFGAGYLADTGGARPNLNVSGDNLRVTIPGHSTDAMRWVLEIHTLIAGD